MPDLKGKTIFITGASRGQSLKTFLTEALKEKLSPRRSQTADWPVPPPNLAKGEMRRVQSTIDEEFSRINAEDWKLCSLVN